ncbi:HAD family hydrolase [Gloeobacter kilaueensis]|uniref:Phosphoglycolate phosphatase n=1 Tax=Gloeobacter kilaueensis (strain ATCC BAA-2537 / CCAP 1431/1 / ULC 316 / JS1) TaxID=1183438 RepID=U5QLN2_GLOK1|nr:HAD family phosphatase [Gloeobacter kilaueensis]AGY59806.1 phosphoglycolate phosphatase [Gloeobacter kilaueensis JS1]
MALRAILFDFNGVLVADEPLHRQLLQQVLKATFGLEVDRADYQQLCLGRSDFEALRAVLQARGRAVSPQAIEALVRQKEALYRQSADPKKLLIAGVADLLDRASASGLRLAIVSGAGRAEIEWILNLTGLAGRFAAVVAAEDTGRGKPDPGGYHLALERLAVRAEEALAVEDSFLGIEAARRAGLRVIALTTSVPMHLLQRRADWVLDRYDDLDLARIESCHRPQRAG